MMKNLAQKIADLQSKSNELDSKFRHAVEKEANALLRRMGVCKEFTYSELCQISVNDSIEKKDHYSLSRETLAFQTVKRYEYIRKIRNKLWEIEIQLNEVEKLFKGE